MSWGNPTVHPRSDTGFADFASSVADAIQQSRARKRQGRLDQTAEEERQRQRGREDAHDAQFAEDRRVQKLLTAIQLANAGYREGEPPALPGDDPVEMVASALPRGNRTQGMPAAPAPEPSAGPSDGIADALLARSRRGNQTQSGMGPVPLGGGNQPPSSPAGPAELGGGYRASSSPTGPVPLGGAPQPSLTKMAGSQFYRLPGGLGYIDQSATPEARAAAARRPKPPWEDAGFSDEASYVDHLRRRREAENPQRAPTPKWQDEGYPSFAAWRADQRASRNTPRPPSAGEARQAEAQRQRTQAEEAEGLAILNSPSLPTELRKPFQKAYNDARKGNVTLSPGRLAKQVFEGLKRGRPDLFPSKRPEQYGGGMEDAELDGDAPAPSQAAAGPSPADRWEELVADGVSPEEATQRVQQEMGG